MKKHHDTHPAADLPAAEPAAIVSPAQAAGGQPLQDQDSEPAVFEPGESAPAKQTPSPAAVAEAELVKVRGDLDALQDRYLRTLAEFDNYKRRTLREREQLVESATSGILFDLVQVREDFERALRAAEAHKAADTAYAGMRLIFTRFDEILGRHGLEPYAVEDEAFDPVLHDAMMKMPHASIADGRIAQVVERGYRLKGNVLKHARVIVSAGAPEPVARQSEQQTDIPSAPETCGDEE